MTEETEKPFPLTKEFITDCYAEMLRWIGYEEGRRERLIAQDPNLAKLSPNCLNYNFDYGLGEGGSAVARMIDDAFFAAFNKPCEMTNFAHIYGNSLQFFTPYPNMAELLQKDRSEVVKFLVEERIDFLEDIAERPKFEPKTDPTFLHLTAKMRLMCFDKLAELMMGEFVAAEIAKDSEQQFKQRSLQASAER